MPGNSLGAQIISTCPPGIGWREQGDSAENRHDERPGFKNISQTNKSQKENPIEKLRTCHSWGSSDLAQGGEGGIDVFVSSGSLRLLAGQDNVRRASPAHTHARSSAGRPRRQWDSSLCLSHVGRPAPSTFVP